MEVDHRIYRLTQLLQLRKNNSGLYGISLYYKPEFFFRLSFCRCKVASITAMIYVYINLHPAIHKNDFHIFITSKLELAANYIP